MHDPSFSIVINTDGRAAALANTLRSLRHLDYPRFEVCVVYGPTPDGTKELLEAWEGQIKIAACPVRNLSVSRNIGIALAAGDVVAFLDDDAIPEPEWLRDLAAAYDAPNVGGAGGFVYDSTGAAFQSRYTTLDRLARPQQRERAMPELSFPWSYEIPHLLGTNCSFRRDALIAVGGFDEQIDRYLDESDVCCRLIDQGWVLKQVAGAYVHHGLLPDDLRTEQRVVRSWYPPIKNKLYVPLVNGRRHHGVEEIVTEARREQAERAWRDGLSTGLAGDRRFIRKDRTRGDDGRDGAGGVLS